MDKRVKAKWVKALRSGKYKQGRGALKTKNGYCCLGVLCDLHSREVNKKPAFEDTTEYLEASGLLPDEVKEWAGLTQGEGNPQLGKHSATHHNDTNRRTFKQIADRIEKYL